MNNKNSIFGSGSAIIECTLKNPNQFREAVAVEIISRLPKSKINEFTKSNEAKAMMESGIISQDSIDMIADEQKSNIIKAAVCQMAKDNNDPEWDDLVEHRMEERRLFNSLFEKYGEDANKLTADIEKDISRMIPEYFRK